MDEKMRIRKADAKEPGRPQAAQMWVPQSDCRHILLLRRYPCISSAKISHLA